MLNIYIGKDCLPKDKELIMDNEAYFSFSDMSKTDFIERVLREIEKGTYLDERTFLDRFNTKVYCSCLSTGSKTLINISTQPDKIFYGGEMGENARTLIMYIKEGNVYFDDDFQGICEPDEYPYEVVKVNGIECNGVYQMQEIIDYGYLLD